VADSDVTWSIWALNARRYFDLPLCGDQNSVDPPNSRFHLVLEGSLYLLRLPSERTGDFGHDTQALLIGCGSRPSNQSKRSTSISKAFCSPAFTALRNSCPSFLHIWIILELEVLPLERDGVVEEELRSVFENIWESIPGEVPMEGLETLVNMKAMLLARGFGEDGGQSGECIVGADSDARDGAIGEDENGSDGVDVLLDLSRNALLVELVLLKTASVGQPRRVEDANLGKRLRILTMFKNLALTTMPFLLVSS
jgi:hypothetical protein